MIKSTLVCLLFFVGMVLGGLLLSNLVLILQVQLSSRVGGVITDMNEAISSLNKQELLTQQMIAQVFSLVLPSFLVFRTCPDFRSMKRNTEFEVNLVLMCLLLYVLSLPIVGLSSYLNHQIPFPEWVYESENQMSDLMTQLLVFESPTDFILALIGIAVIPALAEEWAFRGVLQNIITHATRSPTWGIVLSAILFSSVHMQFLGFIPRLLLGLLLGYFYARTANLWYSIMIHFLNNAGQLVAIYFTKDVNLNELLKHPEMPNLFVVVLSTIAAMYLFWNFHSKTHQPAYDSA